jgi:hypothetical protein
MVSRPSRPEGHAIFCRCYDQLLAVSTTLPLHACRPPLLRQGGRRSDTSSPARCGGCLRPVYMSCTDVASVIAWQSEPQKRRSPQQAHGSARRWVKRGPPSCLPVLHILVCIVAGSASHSRPYVVRAILHQVSTGSCDQHQQNCCQEESKQAVVAAGGTLTLSVQGHTRVAWQCGQQVPRSDQMGTKAACSIQHAVYCLGPAKSAASSGHELWRL